MYTTGYYHNVGTDPEYFHPDCELLRPAVFLSTEFVLGLSLLVVDVYCIQTVLTYTVCSVQALPFDNDNDNDNRKSYTLYLILSYFLS